MESRIKNSRLFNLLEDPNLFRQAAIVFCATPRSFFAQRNWRIQTAMQLLLHAYRSKTQRRATISKTTAIVSQNVI